MTLKRLAEYSRYVWIVCSTDELATEFLKKAVKEGFTTPDGGTPTDLTPYPLYGISGDMCVGYVSRTVAGLVKKHGIHITPQIDFEKFLKGRKSCILLNPYNEIEDFHKWNALVAPFMSYRERKSFDELCDLEPHGLSLQEYKAYIHRFLMLSPWHYTPDQALERMTWEGSPEYIAACYERGESVCGCAVELGYGGG